MALDKAGAIYAPRARYRVNAEQNIILHEPLLYGS